MTPDESAIVAVCLPCIGVWFVVACDGHYHSWLDGISWRVGRRYGFEVTT